ncbi:MAG: hypothetical protein R3F43_32240 [bacterium]
MKWDASLQAIDEEGFIRPRGVPGCDATSSENCTCSANRACVKAGALRRAAVGFMRQVMDAYQLLDVSPRGIY